jgi:hypothetical protein
MAFDSIIWDLDDDPDGNVQHCAEHGVKCSRTRRMPTSAAPPASPLCLETRARADT